MFDSQIRRRRQVRTDIRPAPPARLDDPVVVRWLLGMVLGNMTAPLRIPRSSLAQVAEWSLTLWQQQPRPWTRQELAPRLARLDIDESVKPFWLAACQGTTGTI